MDLHRLFSSLLTRWFGGIVLVFSALSVMYAQSPTAPTASDEPAEIDHVWQKASSKYDAERTALLKEVDAIADQGPFRPDWESLQNARLLSGTRVRQVRHFHSLGSLFGASFWQQMVSAKYVRARIRCVQAPRIATYGTQDKFGYKDFVPMFKAERFDPSAWADLFKKAGAKYVVPVAEHHDGFAMYDSGFSDWTAAKMGPHRDVIGDLSQAVRAEGLHFGVSSHRLEHDFFLGVGERFRRTSTIRSTPRSTGPHNWGHQRGNAVANDFTYVSSAWTDDWLARGAELVDKYHPDIVYFDWWIGQASIRPNLHPLCCVLLQPFPEVWGSRRSHQLQRLCHAGALGGA